MTTISMPLRVAKITLLLLMALVAVVPAYSQAWSYTGSTAYYNTGPVGIGTSTPSPYLLDVHGYIHTNLMFVADAPALLQQAAWFRGYTNGSANILLAGDLGNATPFWLSAAGSTFKIGGTATSGEPAAGAINITSGGAVGIGTTTPSVALEVHGVGALAFTAGASQEMTRLYSNTGNGSQIRFTTNRFAAGSSWTSASTRIQAWTDATPQAYIEFNPNGGSYAMAFGNNNAESMRFTSTGSLLIGKTTQINSTYLLDINGNARANEMVVNTSGADFVFDSAYHLPDLSMVAAYIKSNHHLPQIRSAAEMEKDGLNLGQDQIRLLQKIEELTLYIINQNKELDDLKLQNQRLEDRNRALETLEQRVQRLESLEKPIATSTH